MAACNSHWNELLSAFFDGETTADEAVQVKAHLVDCASCAKTHARNAQLSVSLRRALPEPAPSRQLEQRLRTLAPSRRKTSRLTQIVAGFGAIAAAAAVTLVSWPVSLNQALAGDLERHHFRAFAHVSPCEFESADPVEVGKWVKEAIGQDITVPEVADAQLLGARRCNIGGTLAASLLYREGDHALTLFVFPEGSEPGRKAAEFASKGMRCTSGVLGERICAAPRGNETIVAVAEQESTALAGISASLR